MGIFNQHSDNQPRQSVLRGFRGSPGVGFSLTRDGNYDMNNKKLKNVGEGVESSDAVTKHQLEVSMNSKADKALLNNYVKKNSPEVDADLDMKGHSIKNLKVSSLGSDTSVPSKKYVDQKLNTKADKTSLTRYVKKNSPEVGADLDMKGFEVKNMRLTPTGDLSATSKKYVDSKVNNKANKNDLNSYLKLDGSSQMQDNLQMNNKRITSLPEPQLADEPATKRFVTTTNFNFFNNFLDLQGSAKMMGDLQMNDNRITGLTNVPLYDGEATNKKYVDDNITKSHIKPSHTPKNVFQYLMNDVNEWSTEYNVKVDKFIDLQESPHSWDKRVLKITPVKDGSNYRFRVGLQMFRMKTNETYSLMVERYNRDYKTWQREQTFVNGTGVWVRTYNITKLQYHYGVNDTLYYTKTLIKFKKTSSSAPVFVYYTVHFDDNGGDLNTYPKYFINQIYLVAYGVEGLADNVDPEVYDAHEAFEIDKTKMKMLVPLDMNGKQLMNVNLDIKIGNLFKFISLRAKNFNTISNSKPKETANVKDHNGFRIYTTSTTMFIHSILVFSIYDNDNTGKPQLQIVPGRSSLYPGHYISLFEGLFNKNKKMFTKAISYPAKRGIRGIFITHLNDKLSLDFYLIVSYM